MKTSHPPTYLYCFADAGGSASVFRDWQGALPAHLRVRPIELPGRGTRRGSALLADYRRLVVMLTREIAEDIARMRQIEGNVLYAAFGHGTGADLALGVCSRLAQRLQRQPVHCFLSCGLPLHRERKQRSHLSDEELVTEMRTLCLASLDHTIDSAMMRSLLPVFRTDCAVHEEAVLDAGKRLHCPMTLFTADQDAPLAQDEAWQWDRYSTQATFKMTLQGDRASVLRSPQEVLGHISQAFTSHSISSLPSLFGSR